DLLVRNGPGCGGRRRARRRADHSRARGCGAFDRRYDARRRRGQPLSGRSPRRFPARAGGRRPHPHPGSDCRPGPGGPAGRGGGGGRGGGAASSFGVVTLSGKPAIVNGLTPALSRDGRSVTWIARTGAPAGGGEQRLLLAPVDNLTAPIDLHKGSERLDAPAIAADGARVAFQMMAKEDWEIYLVGRDGKNETRVTRDIQHDI